VLIKSGRSTLPKSASCSSARGPACARAKIAAAGVRFSSFDCELRVRPPAQRVRARLDEGLHERPVLVERRPTVRRVLLEGERQLGAPLELALEQREGAQAEAAEGSVE
jgi:hypothetical protein